MKEQLIKLGQAARHCFERARDALGLINIPGSREPAGCHNILVLLMHLCDGDAARRDWVLRWLAFQLRNPGAKMTTAIVATGSRFSKSIFFEDVLAALFSERSYTILADELYGRAMRWARPPINLVTIHGSFSGRHISRLRALIASSSLIIEQPGKAPEPLRNELNFVLLIDELPASAEPGRRFVVLDAPPDWPRHYYDGVRHEINNGGIEALRDYLLQLDLTGFTDRTPAPAAQARIHQEAA